MIGSRWWALDAWGKVVGEFELRVQATGVMGPALDELKLEDPTVDGVSIIDFGMTVSPQEAPDKVETIKIGFESGVPVMGHLGLTPQSVHAFGGHRVQGRDALAAAMKGATQKGYAMQLLAMLGWTSLPWLWMLRQRRRASDDDRRQALAPCRSSRT